MPNINNGVLEGVRRIGGRFRDVMVDGGLPGAPLGYRLRGATQSGAPTMGTWKAGDQVPDRNGAIWICTAAGTPGTWAQSGIGAISARETWPDMRALGNGYRTDVKLRGVTTTPKVAENSWAVYWGSGFDFSFIQTQLNYALQLGCNAVSVYGNLTNVVAGSQSLASYQANIGQYLSYAASLGLMVYTTIEGSNSANLAYPSLFAQMAAFLATYPNVTGVDVVNEFNSGGGTSPSATQTSQVQAASAAIRAVTSIPISYSFISGFVSSIVSGPQAAWLSLFAANSDFLNLHPYATDPQNIPASAVTAMQAAYPSMPLLFGEVGDLSSLNPSLGARIANFQPNLAQQWCPGMFVFCLNDYSPGFNPGAFDANWNERTVTSWPIRTIPKRRITGAESMPMAIPSAPVSLTTSLTTVPGTTSLLSSAGYDLSYGDPQYRMAAEFTGLTWGDTIEAQIADADSGVLYGPLTTATPASAGSTPDASQSANPVFFAGGQPTTSASPTTGFGNVVSLPSGAYGVISLAAYPGLQGCFSGGTQPWTVECRFIRTRSGVQESLVTGWGGLGVTGVNGWILYIDSSNRLAAGAGGGNFITSAPATIADTNEHVAALTYDGTTLRLFLDGTLGGTHALPSGTSLEYASGAGWQPILIGVSGGTTLTTPFAGAIEEIRLSNTARYTATYTPATSPFTTDASTFGLYHCDSLVNNVVTRIETQWTYVPGPATGLLQVANTTAARGSLTSAAKQVRYSG